MTDQEIARALGRMSREDGKRPQEEQIRDLLEAGVIDAEGRVLMGRGNKVRQDRKTAPTNGPAGPLAGSKS